MIKFSALPTSQVACLVQLKIQKVISSRQTTTTRVDLLLLLPDLLGANRIQLNAINLDNTAGSALLCIGSHLIRTRLEVNGKWMQRRRKKH